MGTSPGTRRGPYAKTRERRLAICAAVFELVQIRGHRDITTADVARRAGVTEATVLYHFPSKEHLFAAALEYPATIEAPDFATELDSVAAVEEHLAAISRSNMARPLMARLYGVLQAEAPDPAHPAHPLFVDRTERLVTLFSGVLRRLAERGEVRLASSPERSARLLVAAWDGLQAQWLTSPDFNLAVEVVEAFRAIAPPQEQRAPVTG